MKYVHGRDELPYSLIDSSKLARGFPIWQGRDVFPNLRSQCTEFRRGRCPYFTVCYVCMSNLTGDAVPTSMSVDYCQSL